MTAVITLCDYGFSNLRSCHDLCTRFPQTHPPIELSVIRDIKELNEEYVAAFSKLRTQLLEHFSPDMNLYDEALNTLKLCYRTQGSGGWVNGRHAVLRFWRALPKDFDDLVRKETNWL